MRFLGLNDDDAKTVPSAAMKEKLRQDEDEEILGAEEARQYKSLAATLNHMSLDRSDVQLEGTEVSWKMADRSRRSWKGLMKARRYSKGVRKVTWLMQAWETVVVVSVGVHVDSDWAKGPERKSTSGSMMMMNGTADETTGDACVEHCRRRM